MDDNRPPLPASAREPLIRPLLWRLPLFAMVAIGIGCLAFLDGLLRREYRANATTQAVQADALLESYFRQRVGLLHGLEVLVASDPGSRVARFPTLAREVFASTRDVRTVSLLDAQGRVRASFRSSGSPGPAGELSDAHREPARVEALERAREERSMAMTGSVRLRDGRLGVVAYDPIIDRGRVTGFVAGSFAYATLFNDALAGQLQGDFAYRVSDAEGRLIAESPGFPTTVGGLVTREVIMPGATGAWQLEVALPRLQPLTARLILWGVGLLLLLLVVLLVIREEQRAERIATHSFHLELLSRDLLDANLRLEERAQQVAEANRAKSRFLANVSHELRTPLNAIVGYNGLALDGVYGDLGGELGAAHQRIGKAAEHLLALVNDVLDLAKIEVGRMRVDAEAVDLRSLVDSVVTVVDPIAAAKNVALDVVLARDLPRLTSDPRHLRQILLNLVSNAVKFTEKGTVTVVARRDEHAPAARVVVTVEDTGIGIAERDLERIFDEFEQVRPSGRGDSQQRGTGLGLAIARKLARLLGGDITVESRLGRGSRFVVALPLVAPVQGEASLDGDERAAVVRTIPPELEVPRVAAADVSRRGAGSEGGRGASDRAESEDANEAPRDDVTPVARP